MAVFHYTLPDGLKIGPRNMHAPKEASERGWWNACRKICHLLPTWSNVRDDIKIVVDEEVITFEWYGGHIMIARRRNLR